MSGVGITVHKPQLSPKEESLKVAAYNAGEAPTELLPSSRLDAWLLVFINSFVTSCCLLRDHTTVHNERLIKYVKLLSLRTIKQQFIDLTFQEVTSRRALPIASFYITSCLQRGATDQLDHTNLNNARNHPTDFHHGDPIRSRAQHQTHRAPNPASPTRHVNIHIPPQHGDIPCRPNPILVRRLPLNTQQPARSAQPLRHIRPLPPPPGPNGRPSDNSPNPRERRIPPRTSRLPRGRRRPPAEAIPRRFARISGWIG